MADKKRALKKVADDEFDVEMSEAFSGGNPKNYKAVISQGLKFDLDAKGKITKLPYLKKKKTPTKKMNMGGVMKSRGGTYKGTY